MALKFPNPFGEKLKIHSIFDTFKQKSIHNFAFPSCFDSSIKCCSLIPSHSITQQQQNIIRNWPLLHPPAPSKLKHSPKIKKHLVICV